MMFNIQPVKPIFPKKKIEVENCRGDSSAMSFITKEAAGIIGYEYMTSGLFPFVSEILGGVTDTDNVCEFKGLSIYLR